MARNLLVAPTAGLVSYPEGRAAIRQGAAKWYLTQVGAPLCVRYGVRHSLLVPSPLNLCV